METKRNIQQARVLRKTETNVERLLWSELRNRRLANYKFRRQFPISGYIVDFVCLEARLVIELDGSQHAERNEQDTLRSQVLAKSGLHILRFWNNEVLQKREEVLTEILRYLEAPPSPQPSPASERGRNDQNFSQKYIFQEAIL